MRNVRIVWELREKLEFPRFLSLILDTVLCDEPFTVRVASSKPSPILLHYSDFKFYEIFVITSCSWNVSIRQVHVSGALEWICAFFANFFEQSKHSGPLGNSSMVKIPVAANSYLFWCRCERQMLTDALPLQLWWSNFCGISVRKRLRWSKAEMTRRKNKACLGRARA